MTTTLQTLIPSFSLGDDGTLDTVIVCDHCGRETRFTFEPWDDGDHDEVEARQTPYAAYDAFVEECLQSCVDGDATCCCGYDHDVTNGICDHCGEECAE